MAAAGMISSLTAQTQASNVRARSMVNDGSSSDGSNSSSNSTGSSSGAATITANDFLTLLVTEMKNQDPTAQTDPNEYINQLVQVNSLQQLISINETLTGALGSTDTSSNSGTESGKSVTAQASPSAASRTRISTDAFSQAPAAPAAATTSGNLNIPGADPAAIRVAHALDGHTRANAYPSFPALH